MARRHPRYVRAVRLRRSTTPDERARALLASAVWHRAPAMGADDPTLEQAMRLARRNHVEVHLARAYPERFDRDGAIEERTALFRRNVEESARLLTSAGVRPILVKAVVDDAYGYSNFDLVVGADGWDRAVRALETWGERRSRHRAEPDKLLVHPASGPAAHLHRSVSWFGVPIVSLRGLRTRATRRAGESWWMPAALDEFRILLAHAAFQNLALDLSELLSFRRLSEPAVVEGARAEADAEGWRRGFELVLDVAVTAIEDLDDGIPPPLPVPLPVRGSLAIALEHAAYLWRSGRTSTAVREGVLRLPLVAAKRWRLWAG